MPWEICAFLLESEVLHSFLQVGGWWLVSPVVCSRAECLNKCIERANLGGISNFQQAYTEVRETCVLQRGEKRGEKRIEEGALRVGLDRLE